MKVWIITDTHLGHKKLIEWGRPVDFEQQITSSLRREVKSEDLLIHLGDVAIGHDEENNLLITSVPCKKILVKGNHDSKSNSWYLGHGWDFVCHSFMDVLWGKRVKFAHAPEPIEEDIDLQLHGHSHGDAHRDEEFCPFYSPEYHKEVALEKTGYRPILLESLLK